MRSPLSRVRNSRRMTPQTEARSIARERLRRYYRPDRVHILFVGESPPASGRFFYQEDSGLFHAVRKTFLSAFPSARKSEFLNLFRALGCYLVDRCREPVDNITRGRRRCACRSEEARLARTIRHLRPEIIITVVRSIGENVKRAREQAAWLGPHLELPYPGRWHRARLQFSRQLVPFLRKMVGGTSGGVLYRQLRLRPQRSHMIFIAKTRKL